jgi:hypothetical protein
MCRQDSAASLWRLCGVPCGVCCLRSVEKCRASVTRFNPHLIQTQAQQAVYSAVLKVRERTCLMKSV